MKINRVIAPIRFKQRVGLPTHYNQIDSGLRVGKVMEAIAPNPRTAQIIDKEKLGVDLNDAFFLPRMLRSVHPTDLPEELTGWQRRFDPYNPRSHVKWQKRVSEDGALTVQTTEVGGNRGNLMAAGYEGKASFAEQWMDNSGMVCKGYLFGMPVHVFAKLTGSTDLQAQGIYLSLFEMVKASGIFPKGILDDPENGRYHVTGFTDGLATNWQGEWHHILHGSGLPEEYNSNVNRDNIPRMDLPHVVQSFDTTDETSYYLDHLYPSVLEAHVSNEGPNSKIMLWIGASRAWSRGPWNLKLKGPVLDFWNALVNEIGI